MDCVGEWVPGECDAECDGSSKTSSGTQVFQYKITKESENGGQDCEAENGEEREDRCQKTDCEGMIF